MRQSKYKLYTSPCQTILPIQSQSPHHPTPNFFLLGFVWFPWPGRIGVGGACATPLPPLAMLLHEIYHLNSCCTSECCEQILTITISPKSLQWSLINPQTFHKALIKGWRLLNVSYHINISQCTHSPCSVLYIVLSSESLGQFFSAVPASLFHMTTSLLLYG